MIFKKRVMGRRWNFVIVLFMEKKKESSLQSASPTHVFHTNLSCIVFVSLHVNVVIFYFFRHHLYKLPHHY